MFTRRLIWYLKSQNIICKKHVLLTLESDDDYVAFVVICAVIAALVLFSCFAIYIYRHSSFSFPFFEDPSKRSQLLNRPIEMRVQMSNPYTVDTAGSKIFVSKFESYFALFSRSFQS